MTQDGYAPCNRQTIWFERECDLEGALGLADSVRMERPNAEIRSAKAVLECVTEKFPACDSRRRVLGVYNFPPSVALTDS